MNAIRGLNFVSNQSSDRGNTVFIGDVDVDDRAGQMQALGATGSTENWQEVT